MEVRSSDLICVPKGGHSRARVRRDQITGVEISRPGNDGHWHVCLWGVHHGAVLIHFSTAADARRWVVDVLGWEIAAEEMSVEAFDAQLAATKAGRTSHQS